jgi:hypothetical protein
LGAYLQGQMDNAITGLGRFAASTVFTTQKTATATAAAVVAVFGELTSAGFSAQEVIQRLAPILATLGEKFEDAGLTGGAAFAHLNHLAQLFGNEYVQAASESVGGLVQILTALANTGLLTQDMFEGLAASIVETYQGLINQGHSANDALLVIRPGLQRIWEIQKDFGFVTDAATQALIDQAEAAGLIGEKFRDPMRQLTDAINHMIERLGVFITDLGTMGETAERESGRARRGLESTGTAVPRPPTTTVTDAVNYGVHRLGVFNEYLEGMGDAGDALTPTSQTALSTGAGDVHVHVTIDPDTGRVTKQRVERQIKRMAALGAFREPATRGWGA